MLPPLVHEEMSDISKTLYLGFLIEGGGAMVDTLLGTFFPLPPPEDTPPLFMGVSMLVI